VNLLDPALLAKLATLKLRARAVTEGVLTGLHRSPHHGQSVEFAEHKEYTPGDDVRHIDWKAYAKFDKYYVKRFEQETNLRAWLVVDASGSMGFTGDAGRLTKLEVASTLAASLAHLLVRQGDAAGVLAVADGVVRALAPRAAAAHLAGIVETLSALAPAGRTRLGAAVDHVVEHAPRRGQVVLFSDLLEHEGEVLKDLAQLRRRKHEVTLFHVLDPAELDFPYDDEALFLSMEDAGMQVEAHGREVRKGYLEEFHRWRAGLQREAAATDVEYVLCRTDRPLDEVLVPFLARRMRRAAP
jgi:uncharacterized protein (DUF58 family)